MYKPQVLLITPSDTTISQEILDAATKAGVEVWQSKLQETQNKQGKPVVGLGPETLLNFPQPFNLPPWMPIFDAIPIGMR